MKKFLNKSTIIVLVAVLCLSACLLFSCGEKEGPADESNVQMTTYNIGVQKGMVLGELKAEPVKSQDGGTLYKFEVNPKVGYNVKKFTLNGVEFALTDNKLETVLTADTVLSVEYERKTSDELTRRQNVILEKMEQLVGMQYKTDKTYQYDLNGNTIVLKEGNVYQGMPYTPYASTSPDAFLGFAVSQDDKGVYTMSFPTGYNPLYWGNSCGNSVYWSWASIASSIRCTWSVDMVEENGVIPVGEFTYNKETDISNRKWVDTVKVCEANGEAVMADAYALLQPADSLTYKSPKGNHTLIVVSTNVVRNANGVVSLERSNIRYHDQHGGLNTVSGKNGGNVQTSCSYNGQMSFREMYETGYLPVTCIELLDDSTPIAKAEIKYSMAGSQVSALNVTRGYVESNYYISKVEMVVTDANGNEVYNDFRMGVEENPRRLSFSTFATTSGEYNVANVYAKAFNVDELPAGTYKVVATAHLSNGEKLVACDFQFTK